MLHWYSECVKKDKILIRYIVNMYNKLTWKEEGFRDMGRGRERERVYASKYSRD